MGLRGRGWERRSAPSEADAHGDIESLCERLGAHTLARADSGALEVAGHLTRDLQFFAYSALLGSGWARGSVRCHVPGGDFSASGLSPLSGLEFVDGIRAGRSEC